MTRRFASPDVLTGASGPDVAAQDAEAVLAYVKANEFASEADLRVWCDQRGIDPDRATAAIEALQQAGRLHCLDDDVEVPAAHAREPFEDMTVDTLSGIASDLNVAGRSSMSKDELVSAIRDAIRAVKEQA